MKGERISVKSIIETLTNKEMKATIGGYDDEGDGYESNAAPVDCSLSAKPSCNGTCTPVWKDGNLVSRKCKHISGPGILISFCACQ